MTIRHARLALCLLPGTVFILLLSAAAPVAEISPDELIRRANAAFAAKDLDDAARFYAAAEERTGDPGLVAFNRAAVLFATDEFRDAEVHYARVLEDAACPPHRAAKAWYNRGTCLLRRGNMPAVYRSAIACFEHCLDSPAADEPLKADARHNLELAKLLWNEVRKTAAKLDTPNENRPPEEDPQNSPPMLPGSDQQPGNGDPTGGSVGSSQSIPQQIPNQATGANPDSAQQPNRGGNGQHLQPLQNDTQLQVLSPEDTREYLRRSAGRLKKERQDLWRTLYGKVGAGVRDW